MPTSSFKDETFEKMTEAGLYCSNTVRCSGDYHQYQKENGELMINEKLRRITNHFIPNFDDFVSVRCPIENRLYFHNIPQETLISFCDKWLEIGKFVDSNGLQRYGDCFEITPCCILHKINIIHTDYLPFDDNFKGGFADMFNKRHNKQNCPEEYRNLNDDEFLDYALTKF